MKKLGQRIVENIGANSIGKIITIFSQVLLVPIFLSFWGVTTYGEWLVITAIPTYLSISDLGFGHASTNEMVKQYNIGNQSKALVIFQSTTIFIFVMSFLGSVLILILLSLFPINQLLEFESISTQDAFLIWIFLILKFIFSQQIGMLLAWFRVFGRNAKGVMLSNYFLFFQLGIVMIFVSLGARPWMVALLDFLVTFSTYLIALKLVKNYKIIKYGVPKDLRKVVKEIFYPALTFMAFPFSQIALIQSTIIIVGSLLNPTAVVIYTTIRIVTNACLRLLEIVSHSFWPEITIAYGRNDIKLVRILNRLGSKVTVWLSISGFTCLIFLGEYIYSLWTNSKVAWDESFFILMVVAAFIDSFSIFTRVIPTATNQLSRVVKKQILNSLVAMPLMWLFIKYFDLNGVTIVLIIHNMILSYIMISVALKLSCDQAYSFFSHIFSLKGLAVRKFNIF